MGCWHMLNHDDVQKALSARLDGETYELSDDLIDTHISGCAECAAFAEKAGKLGRRLGTIELSDAGMAPPRDLADVILAGVEPAWRQASRARAASLAVARTVLVIVGVAFTGWALAIVAQSSGLTALQADGETLSPQADPVRAHLLMETAALRAGVALGLFYCAWRPVIIPGLLAVVATMDVFLIGFAMRDVALGTLSHAHLFNLVGLTCAVVALAWCWAADRAISPLRWWRELNAQPV